MKVNINHFDGIISQIQGDIMQVTKELLGNYEVTKDGRVFRVKGTSGKMGEMFGRYQRGYKMIAVTLTNGIRLSTSIHRLVAILYIPNPENKPEVNHINGIKDDNRVENLEWVTSSENQLHAFATGLQPYSSNNKNGNHQGSKCHLAKLDEDTVYRIRCDKFLMSYTKLSAKYGISASTLEKICSKTNKNAIWKHVAYPTIEEATNERVA